MDATWRDEPQRYDAMIGPFGRQAHAAAGIAAGARVLDVGAGASETPIELARRVGPGGRVVVLELSDELVTVGRARALAAGSSDAEWPDIEWIVADVGAPFADLGLPPAGFDAVVSRFALMLVDPHAAFSNLHRALRPGGRMAFTCWQSADRNAWFTLPMSAVETVLPGASAGAGASHSDGGPGPFSYADPELLHKRLDAAGFVDVRIEPLVHPVRVATDVDDALAFFERRFGDVAELLDAPTLARVRQVARELLAPYAQPDGVRLSAAAWLVTCARP